MKQLITLFLVLAVVGVGGTGYFYLQHQKRVREIVVLKEEKIKLEKEFAELKNTDLARELLSVRSELGSTEGKLKDERRMHANTATTLKEVESRKQFLEAGIKKAKSYGAALSAFNDWQFLASPFPLPDRDTRSVDAAIAALGDQAVSRLWQEVKSGFPEGKKTGNLRFEEVILLITSKLVNALQ